ncbi:hypothetical protein K440DRAFT_636634 [Wilcoxina mikolae CBS 423.85]|nr:hypothetical protein K440DRAFT_636634 [Wilcoxina mikolae CBS 423.85]
MHTIKNYQDSISNDYIGDKVMEDDTKNPFLDDNRLDYNAKRVISAAKASDPYFVIVVHLNQHQNKEIQVTEYVVGFKYNIRLSHLANIKQDYNVFKVDTSTDEMTDITPTGKIISVHTDSFTSNNKMVPVPTIKPLPITIYKMIQVNDNEDYDDREIPNNIK